MVEFVALLLEHSHVRKHSESLGESPWHEELQMVVLCQFHSHMLSVCRGAFADVNSDVEYRAVDAAHELGLGERRTLEMQSAHYAPG